jgi:predicted  nucleic acid-binding Zn-ribbon protein
MSILKIETILIYLIISCSIGSYDIAAQKLYEDDEVYKTAIEKGRFAVKF